MFKKKLLSLSMSASCLMLTSPLALSANGPDLRLEEIIVTSQRRLENLQDVPLSVQSVSSEVLDTRNLNDLQQLTLAAPGLQIGQDNSFSMRGIGTLVFGETVDSSVGLSIDEVNYGRSAMVGAAFNDVERIEVLFGPQGLLFGKNASAGLLNVITARPEIGNVEGKIDTEYVVRDTTPNEGNGLLIKGAINTPVTENSALRVNVLYSSQDPVAVFDGGGADVDEEAEQQGLKLKFLTELSEDLELYIIADYSEESGVAGIFDRTYRETGAGSGTAPVLAADGITAGDENLKYTADGDLFRDLETGGFQASVTYLLDNGMEFFNVTSWRFFDREQQIDTDYSSANGLSLNYNNTEYEQYSSEFRLALSDENRLTGQVGLFYFNSTVDAESILGGSSGIPDFVLTGFPFCIGDPASVDPFCGVTGTSNTSFLGSDSASTMETESYALFTQLNYELNDKLNLIMGARVTYDEVSLELDSGRGADGYFVNIGGLPGQYTDEADNTNFSGKLGLQYYFTRDVMSYVTFSSGYKSPGFNDSVASALTPLAVEDETSTNIELGIKSNLLDGRLILNGSLFRQEFDDYQIQSFDAIAQTFITQNAAEVTTQGLELSLTALLAENLTLTNSSTFLDSTFDDFPGAQCYPGQSGCDAAGTFNARGKDLPLAADITSTTQLMYEFSLSNSLNAYVEGNWYYRSDLNFKTSGAPGTELDAINLLGFSAGVRSEDGWNASLFCKNCTDEKVPTFIDFDAGDASSGIATYVQAWGLNSVRTIGVNFGYEF